MRRLRFVCKCCTFGVDETNRTVEIVVLLLKQYYDQASNDRRRDKFTDIMCLTYSEKVSTGLLFLFIYVYRNCICCKYFSLIISLLSRGKQSVTVGDSDQLIILLPAYY